MSTKKRDPKSDWFAVRQPLSDRRSSVLMAGSFILPLLLWAFFAYTPGLWEVSHKVEITTDLKSEDFPTIYASDFVMEAERFESFQKMVRAKNQEIESYWTKGGDLPEGTSLSSRANQKILRKLHPLAVDQEWMTPEQSTDTAAFFQLWKKLTLEPEAAKTAKLSSENREILSKNWERLKDVGDTYESSLFPKEPLLHLIPTGERAVGRPSYLPAPHEVLNAGIEMFRGKSDREDSSMWSRYRASLAIVFVGFLVACLVGVPIGLLAGTFDFFSKLFEPFVDFFRYMPAPAFGTLLVFLLGSHDAPKVAIVFLGTICQVVLMVANTTRQLDPGLLDAAQTLGAKKQDLIFKVVIPGIIHNLYNDLRILLGWAWTWLVIAELLGVKSGLTEIIDTQGRRFHFDIVYAVILLIGITGFVTDQFLAKLRPILFPWVAQSDEKTSWLTKAIRWIPRTLSKLRGAPTPSASI